MPGAVIAGVLAAGEWRDPLGDSLWIRIRRLSALVLPFAAGVVIPIAIFVIPYAASGAVGALFRGVFIAPMRRYGSAVLPPASLGTFGMALPWLLVLIPPQTRGRLSQCHCGWSPRVSRARWRSRSIAAARGGVAYVVVWLMICYVAPCTVLAGSILAWRWAPLPEAATATQRTHSGCSSP